MRVRDLIRSKPETLFTAEPKDELSTAIHRLIKNNVGGLPVVSSDGDESIEEAMRRVTAQRQRHLVVLQGKDILGVLSVGDMVKYRLEQLETEAGVLRDYVAAQRAAH
ncbi:MAG TPA: CBS domain-containing protein [Gemmatimonadaceae bacterium]